MYCIAKQIQWSRPMEFECMTIRLGGFLVVQTYMAALGNKMESSGFKIIIDSGLVTATMAKEILGAKHCYRSLCTHKIVHEAPTWPYLAALGEWLAVKKSLEPTRNLHVNTTELSPSDLKNLHNISQQLLGLNQQFSSDMHQSSKLFSFWSLYLPLCWCIASINMSQLYWGLEPPSPKSGHSVSTIQQPEQTQQFMLGAHIIWMIWENC